MAGRTSAQPLNKSLTGGPIGQAAATAMPAHSSQPRLGERKLRLGVVEDVRTSEIYVCTGEINFRVADRIPVQINLFMRIV